MGKISNPGRSMARAVYMGARSLKAACKQLRRLLIRRDEVKVALLQEKRLLDKTFRLMEQVVKCCQAQRLNLKNSPPFILDILPDTYQHLMLVVSTDPVVIRDNQYLQLFIENVQSKCKQVGDVSRRSDCAKITALDGGRT